MPRCIRPMVGHLSIPLITYAEVAEPGLTRKPGKLVSRKGSLSSNLNLGEPFLSSRRNKGLHPKERRSGPCWATVNIPVRHSFVYISSVGLYAPHREGQDAVEACRCHLQYQKLGRGEPSAVWVPNLNLGEPPPRGCLHPQNALRACQLTKKM